MTTDNLTPEQLALFQQLTPLRQRLALRRLAGSPLSVAAVEAGMSYSAARTAEESETFQAFIMSVQGELIGHAIMEREELLERLTVIARTTFDDVIETYAGRTLMDPETGEIIEDCSPLWKMRPVEEMRNGGLLAVRSLKITRKGVEVELHDQREAMKQIQILQGWEAPKKYQDIGDDDFTEIESTIVDPGADET